MKNFCAWCKKPLGEDTEEEGGTTHGICPACEALVRYEGAVDIPSTERQ